MAEVYRKFASFLRFKEVLSDPLGHLDRAGEIDAREVRRAVWIRIFDRSSIPAEEVVAAFGRAQKIAESVQSNSLPTGTTFVVDDGTPAVAIDYVASHTLTGVLDRVSNEHIPTPVDNALLIADKIAHALSATLTEEIDGERIVHGFLHPGLIFVSNDGEVLVSAFGVADQLLALVDDVESASYIYPYLAPEVLQTRAPSRRGDVYSLGAILFQLLTGATLPTEPDDRVQAIGTAKLPYEGEPVPDDITRLLQRTLAPHPEQRFASAADFKQELDRLLYGGIYSPTTFNLALFMDRLFRADIEAEESALAREMATDVGPYFAPEVTPESAAQETTVERASRSFGQPLWIGLAAIFSAAIAVILWLVLGGGPSSSQPPPPTPTAEEIAAQRLAQEARMRELAEGLVAEMMAEKEEEIRQELLDRQAKIDELQRRLADSERLAQQGQVSSDDVRRREELQRQIAAEEEAQRQLEADRQQAAEEAQRQAVAYQTATAAAEAAASATPPPPRLSPTAVPTPVPTALMRVVKEDSFIGSTEVDALPVIIKESPVTWPRAALHSQRHGVVILRATVNSTGTVEDVEVLRADHEGFGIPQAVMDAVMQYRFKPATKDGVLVKTHVTVTKAYRFVAR
jgi:TonB family protein